MGILHYTYTCMHIIVHFLVLFGTGSGNLVKADTEFEKVHAT